MDEPKKDSVFSRLWQFGKRSAQQINQWSNGWLGILALAASQSVKPDSVYSAGSIAYFAIFSLFPFTLLIIAIGTLGFGSMINEQLIIQRVEFITPALGQLLGENIDQIILARGPVSILALAGLAWSASSFFSILTYTLNKIWGIKRSRPIWTQRGLGLLFILALVALLLFLASFTNLFPWLPIQAIEGMGVINFLFYVILDAALFMILYLILPHGKSGWRDNLPGAVGAGLLWELAKKAFALFISTYISLSNLIYGSVAAIIAVLTWAYLSGFIFIFGAYVTVYYRQYKSNK